MSSDEDWEFSALEEDKRTFPELVIEVGKSYADAVLQQRSGDRDRGDREPKEATKVVPIAHEFVHVETPTVLRVKPGRKPENMKRQSKGKKDEKISSILKREQPLSFDMPPEKNPQVALAVDFALSDACSALMAQLDQNTTRSRMPYTKQFSNKF